MADEDSNELSTGVTTSGTPSDTYTGAQVLPSAQAPAWLAPAGRRAESASRGRPSRASSPAPPPAERAEGIASARAIAPHPAREMIADLREGRSAAPEEAPTHATEAAPALALDVFWWDDACDGLTAREEGYRALVAQVTARSRAAEAAMDPWWDEADDVVADDETPQTEQTVLLVMREAPLLPLAMVERQMMRALESRRGISAPLGLIAAELRLGFDARAALTVYAEAARPLAKSDKALAATLEHVAQLLETPLGDVAEVARGQRARIAQQWRAANRELPDDFLERSAEEILLRRRSYETREVLDELHLRALLVDGDQAVPLYLPEAAGKQLPLFHAFEARVITELWPRQDEREAHPVALRAIAVARRVE